MNIGFLLAPLALLAANPSPAQDVPVPGDPGVGSWVPFLVNDQGTYTFDKPNLVRRDGHVVARWKVAWKDGAITLQVVDLDCKARVFSELATTVINPDGSRRVIAAADLWVAHPIADGDSMESFVTIVCP